MKKIIIISISIIAAILLAIGGYFAYIYFTSSAKNKKAFNVIPTDAVCIIETSNLTKAWQSIQESKLWGFLQKSEYISDINSQVEQINDLMGKNSSLDLILSDRKLIVSTHLTTRSNFDFLFILDMKKAYEIPFLVEAFKLTDFNVNTIVFRGEKIIVLTDKETEKKIYLATIDNLIAVSFNQYLVLDAILQNREENNWDNLENFQLVSGQISKISLFNLYLNYKQMTRFTKAIISEESELLSTIINTLQYSAFNMNFEDEMFSLNGFTNLSELDSYIKALSKVKPGKFGSHEVMSNQTAVAIAMCFKDFDSFFQILEEEFAENNSGDYKNYNKKIKKIEDFIDVDLRKDFFSWIGSEITFYKLRQATEDTRAQDVIMAINAEDIDDAKKGLNHITTMVNKRTPLNFKKKNYNNFEINYLNIPGFLKLFFGKLFRKLEKPYFTYINDYVIFSNSEITLKRVIDDFISGKTLERKNAFNNFINGFSSKSNISVYIQTPKVYSIFYQHTKQDMKNTLKKNKSLIMSFANIGFQLTSDGDLMKTSFMALHDEDAVMENELEELETGAADKLFNKEYETLAFKIKLAEEELQNEGKYELKNDAGEVIAEGKISNNNLDGLWKSYYENGNIKSSVNYENGKVNGTATFYYDNKNQSKKARVVFEEDRIADVYKEFYYNGARKAVINYKKGKMHGKAKFFYTTGNLKIEAYYKNGKRDGTWKHYTEREDVFKKVKWKKGVKVD